MNLSCTGAQIYPEHGFGRKNENESKSWSNPKPSNCFKIIHGDDFVKLLTKVASAVSVN